MDARFYAVNDRPIKFEPTPEGGLDVLALDFVTGALVRDMSYLSRVSDVSQDVDQLSEAQFDELCAMQLRSTSTPRIEVLREIRRLVVTSDNFTYSWWDDPEEALVEIDAGLYALHRGDGGMAASVLFLPTSGLQELSLSSGWGNDFVDLANRWDAAPPEPPMA